MMHHDTLIINIKTIMLPPIILGILISFWIVATVRLGKYNPNTGTWERGTFVLGTTLGMVITFIFLILMNTN